MSNPRPLGRAKRRQRPSAGALAVAHELALVTGRMVTWTYDAAADRVWWSDPVGDAFALDLSGADDGGRWLLEPVLARLESNPWRYAELELDHPVVDRDGQPVVLLIRARPVPSTGELAGVIADVTEHRAAETTLRDLLDRYRFLVDHSPDAIVVHQKGVVRFVNPAAMEFARLVTAEETGTLTGTEPAHPDVAAEMLSRIGGLIEPGAVPEPVEARIVRPDGSELIVESTGVRTTWDGEPAVQVILRDITERRANELQLLFQATHDALTGLANRGPLLDELQQRLDRTTDPECTATGLLFLDLDRFKAVNDTLGHISGDEFLTVIASRLMTAAPSPDVVGRLAGDEFVVILDSVRDIDHAMAVASDIGQVISEPTLLRSGQTAAITASIGVAVGDGTSFDAEDMLRSADAAMYRAKQLGRSRVEAYDEVLGARIRRRLDLQNELRVALERGDIIVHYQPIIDLVSGRHVGLEALARWPHATLGWVLPEDFIAVAERSGLILPLGDLILQRAVSEFVAWRKGQPDGSDLYLSVNVSNRQFSSYTVDLVRRVLVEADLEPDLLWLEITGSALVTDPDSASRVLTELRGLGVHLGIDDFGTGYSSLLSLKRYPVELVKIDRSFIEGLGTDADSDAIVTAVIRLAQSLNLTTIAEGVETEQQHQELVRRGCTLAQGYRFGPPEAL